MSLSILISSVNYNGQVGDITFYPSTGGTINIGSQTIPYTYVTDYPYGTYDIYFPLFNKTCSSTINPPEPEIIDAILIDGGSGYLIPGDDEYLMFVDP